jgi:predicted GIY-YIG superfamily endonuclease
VSSSQQLLFPDPRPLVERLGREFFRELPEQPGVYLMRDAAETVLYVGKAKNLRQRLTSYRVANPDRMRRRHLRLLRSVARIELECCTDEKGALARESELLRSLKPKYNRAGTWPATPRFLAWRRDGDDLEISVAEIPEEGWRRFGPLGAGALYLRGALLRLLWLAIHPELGAGQMPAGWHQGRRAGVTRIQCGSLADEATSFLKNLLAGEVEAFCDWVKVRRALNTHPFDQAALAEDIEALKKMAALPQTATP